MRKCDIVVSKVLINLCIQDLTPEFLRPWVELKKHLHNNNDHNEMYNYI